MVHDRSSLGRGLLWPMDVGSPLWVIQNLGAEDELASQVLDTLMDQWNQAHIFARRLFIFPPSLMLDAPDLIPTPPRWATQHLLPWSDRLDGVLAEEPRDALLGFWALPLTEWDRVLTQYATHPFVLMTRIIPTAWQHRLPLVIQCQRSTDRWLQT